MLTAAVMLLVYGTAIWLGALGRSPIGARSG
jgi:hypothetical protein